LQGLDGGLIASFTKGFHGRLSYFGRVVRKSLDQVTHRYSTAGPPQGTRSLGTLLRRLPIPQIADRCDQEIGQRIRFEFAHVAQGCG